MCGPSRNIEPDTHPAPFRSRLKSSSSGCASYHEIARSSLTAAAPTVLLRRRRCAHCAHAVTPPRTSRRGFRNGPLPVGANWERTMADILELVDLEELRQQVREKYAEVAADPSASYHFHTGRSHA